MSSVSFSSPAFSFWSPRKALCFVSFSFVSFLPGIVTATLSSTSLVKVVFFFKALNAVAASPRYAAALDAARNTLSSASTPALIARSLVFGLCASQLEVIASNASAAFTPRASASATSAAATSASSVACRTVRGTFRGSSLGCTFFTTPPYVWPLVVPITGRSPSGNLPSRAFVAARRSAPVSRARASSSSFDDFDIPHPRLKPGGRFPRLLVFSSSSREDENKETPMRLGTLVRSSALVVGSCLPAGPAPFGRSASLSRREPAAMRFFVSAETAALSTRLGSVSASRSSPCRWTAVSVDRAFRLSASRRASSAGGTKSNARGVGAAASDRGTTRSSSGAYRGRCF
mmetsp:Transcript_6872/g.29285  ORF Transcript_6872/g.29285 Transcript_6872/m.29285 type:complete len:346 (-) Transcript_6872:98-1135(-)